MAEEVIKITADISSLRTQLDAAEKSLDKLNQTAGKTGDSITTSQQEAAASTKQTTEAIKEQGSVTGDLKNKFTDLLKSSPFGRLAIMLNGYAASMRAATTATTATTIAVRVFTKALMATGIGLIVVALGSLVAAFKTTEQGQNRFAKLLGILGSIVGNFVDLLATFGNKLMDVFLSPREALQSFAKLLRENIINRFEGLIELVPKLGEAISLLFKGEFAAAGKVATDAVGKVALGVESVTDNIKAAGQATKDFIDEQIREAKIAADIADKRAKADKLEREAIVDRAKAESQINELRLKAKQQDQFSSQERIKALKEAQAIEESLIDKEIAFLKLRADALTLENSLAGSTKESLLEEAQAQAELLKAQADRIAVQRSMQDEMNDINSSIRRQAVLEAKQKADENKALLKAGEEMSRAIQKQREEEIALILKNAEAVIDSLKTEIEKRDELYNENKKALQAALDAELIAYEQYTDAIRRLDEKLAADKEKGKEEEDKKAEDDRKKQLQDEIDYQKALGAARVQIAQNIIDTLSIIASDNAEATKALAVFQALLNAYLSITSVLSDTTIPTVVKPFLAASIGALAFAQVAKIQATEVPSFFTGTEYLELNGNRKGRDTIPVMAHEGEAIIPADKNARYPGLASAWIKGDLDSYIRREHLDPILKRNKEYQDQVNATYLAHAFASMNNNLDDTRIVSELKRSRRVSEDMVWVLQQSQTRRNRYRA